MTLEDLQYLIETATIKELLENLTDKIIIHYARVQLDQIPSHLFESPQDWQLMLGTVDQYRRTHHITFKQKYSLLHALQRPSNLIQVW